MVLHPVVTLDEPDLQPYKTLRRPLEHQRKGVFVAEGEKVVARLFESDLEIVSLLLTPEWLDFYRPLLETKPESVHVFVAPKHLVESIVGFHLHQGIMAVGRIPVPLTLAEALAKRRRPALFVAVDGLTNAENLGVLVRNCAAFDVDAVLVGETSSSPYLRRAVRNSMGTVFRLPVVHLTSLIEAIGEMRSRHNIHVVAAHPHALHGTLQEASFGKECCIVFGSEGEGINPSVLSVCDESVAISMRRGVDSLNVASASAVFLYEAQRQRKISTLSE
jgi:tRNA G18 (ribose-2'-O)-methylase SpoU